MGKFSEYGKRLDSITRSAIDNYIEARTNVEIAEATYNRENDPYKTLNNYEQQAKAARAKATLLEMQQELKEAQKHMISEIDSIREVGKELQQAITEHYSAKGESVDMGTLELLKSGILTADEYCILYDKAQKEENFTMMRLIGKYADDNAKKAPTDKAEIKLRNLANNAAYQKGSKYIDMFNVFADAYIRTANNPAMVGDWDNITADIIQSF